MSSRRRARDEVGFTIVEIMVSVILAGIVTGFAFSIYSRASQASRAQSRVSEAQQTLRAATELVTRELRAAGTMARSISVLPGFQTLRPLTIDNDAGGDGPDSFRVLYADLSAVTRVEDAAFQVDKTQVASTAGFAVGDLMLAVHSYPPDPNDGEACVLRVTGLAAGPPVIVHDGGGAPWNDGVNPHCAAVNVNWGSRTSVAKLVARAYRILPGDVRGVLQMSPSGGLVPGDWQDIALGVVDLQLALLVHEPGDATDADGDGKPEFDWYSGDNMETALDTPSKQPIQARLSLLTKTPVNAVTITATPDFYNPAMGIDNNDIADRKGTPLPVTDPSSPYHGENLYRWTSTMIDLRNMGTGVSRPVTP